MKGDQDSDVRSAFLNKAGLDEPSYQEVVNAIKQIPHGRPSDRSAMGVVQDWRGTCSTKLLLLREVAPAVPLQFFNRIFRLTPHAAAKHLGPEFEEVVSEDGMLDVHTFAKALVDDEWRTLDVTFPGQPWDGSSDMEIPWGDGDDYAAGDDPIAHKEMLVKKYGDPAARDRLVKALSMSPGE